MPSFSTAPGSTQTKDTTPSFVLMDTHCHIDFDAFDHDREDVLGNCERKHIAALVIPGVRSCQWDKIMALSSLTRQIRLLPALGLHPYFIDEHSCSDLTRLERQLKRYPDKIIAVGETGLDFYHGTENRERQLEFFTAQVKLAKKQKKPLIIHSRKSHDSVAKIIRRQQFEYGGIVHAFSGSVQQAEVFLRLGFYLGIGGAVTWPRARKLRAIVSSLPLSSFVLETDAPDMPIKQGEKRNTPENLPIIFDTLCTLRPESRDTIASALIENSVLALRLP